MSDAEQLASKLDECLKPILERPGITGNVEFQKELAAIARRYLDLLNVQYEATMGGYSHDSVHYKRIDANMVQLNDESRECIKLFEVPLKEYMTSYLCPKRPDLWAARSPESEFDRAEAADALLGSLINAAMMAMPDRKRCSVPDSYDVPRHYSWLLEAQRRELLESKAKTNLPR